MTDDDLAEQVRAELDPTPAHAVDWPVSRRRVLGALASVGALSVGPSGAQGAAGTGIADEAYFSNYGWTSTADGGELTIDGATFTFDGTEEIGLPDGGTGTELLTPSGATATEVIDEDGRVVFERVTIPDSVVSREVDDASSNITSRDGLEIEAKSDWPSIGARVSANTTGVTRAYINESDNGSLGALLDEIDISGLSSGDAFTFDNIDLVSGNRYIITLDAEGGSYTRGYHSDGRGYPYTSTDVDITAAFDGSSTDTGAQARSINDIGNTGF